ncbi:pyridoxal phosphate-dependent aminotransferase [Nordella sp. HKS 07]|uniref:pyridoxal phosphate-dependent aminotransferase n=1 Tax=Nordella sp. HKS 07 TaxID=2712222 RepID=UPI0013E20663|nr:pyridoxal phosphate-dependent aminotransferase [Nordella sp. HKS 07]QIG47499.1 pyridoxal phosphate-dependent aminotransferase [Nordella sp. HKS 07]
MRYAKITERLQGLGSEKWAVHVEGKEREARGEKLIFLSIGEPDAAVPEAIMDVADRQMRAGRTRYSNGRGEPQVLRALSSMYSKRSGRHVTPSQFLFLPGTQTALYVAFMGTIDIGDEVLLPDPYYATYEGVIAAAGGIPVPVLADPDRGFHLNADDLARKITPKTRALLLNTPGNPTGTVFTADEIAGIGALCRKHDLWIISDEVYATLTYGNTVFVSPFDDASLEERTIVVSSVSKSHAMPGFRCGWIAASEEFCARILPMSETILFGSQPFLEDATAFALENYFPEVEEMKVNYEKRARALIAGLKGARTISARMPEGGMFVMVDVRKSGLTGDEFARRLLAEEAVVTMPGESFGEGGGGHLRVALTVDEAQITEASKRIRRLAERIG